MTLTHEKVRAILARLERDGQPDGCDHDCDGRCDECSPLHDTQALCEEWLARRTVRWANGDLLSMLGRFGTVRYDSKARSWVARLGTDCARGTEDYVRAWLEARVREAGYEVAT